MAENYVMELSDQDRKIYEWQLDVPGLGESGQVRLRGSTALVSRVGGLGGPLCFSLAAAGIGKLIVAHRGDLRLDDLNRQILMSYEGVGKATTSAMVIASLLIVITNLFLTLILNYFFPLRLTTY